MIFYDFKCPVCGKVFDYYFSIEEYEKNKDNLECPDCHVKLKRVYSSVDFKLLGLGWGNDVSPYDVTERELQRNRDASMFLSDEIKKKENIKW